MLRIRIRFDADPSPFLCGSGSLFLFDADPDPTFHSDANPDANPDPSFQIKAQNVGTQIGSCSIHFGLSSANWCGFGCGSGSRLSVWCGSGWRCGSWDLFDADPDADPEPDFYLMRMRIRKRMRIRMRIRCGSGFPKWCGSGSTKLATAISINGEKCHRTYKSRSSIFHKGLKLFLIGWIFCLIRAVA